MILSTHDGSVPSVVVARLKYRQSRLLSRFVSVPQIADCVPRRHISDVASSRVFQAGRDLLHQFGPCSQIRGLFGRVRDGNPNARERMRNRNASCTA